MRDLIRNYKMILKKKNESESESECQPLMHSCSSSSQSFGAFSDSCIFKNDSDTDEVPQAKFIPNSTLIPSVLLEKKMNRKMLYPTSYQTPELDDFENIFEKDICNMNENNLHQKFVLSNSFHDYRIIEGAHTHSSIVTIFAIWNTTVGTSLLSMSWGIEKTGLFPAIFMNILVAAICLYTISTLLKVNEKHGLVGYNYEVSDLCKQFIGKWAEILAKIFSLIVLIGANIVYWILMSNFFYNSVHSLYDFLTNLDQMAITNQSVICPKEIITNETLPNVTTFDQIWNLYSTVPIVLALIMFPMLNWKSPTFFTKFNSSGTLSVLYLIIFVAAKSWSWGINIKDWNVEFDLKSTFCALSGMLSLSYFIHNIIISLMRNNRYQKNNNRDLIIAFGLITFTYLFVGVMFYIGFPLAKYCIEDNILNNFDKSDLLTVIARMLLLFQLFTVFPLISYMLRNDIFANLHMMFKGRKFREFTYGRVITFNIIILTICILFACFLPRIGTLIRYTGALSGMVYIFMLPSLLKLASLKKEGNLNVFQTIFHIFIISLGCLNLVSQFFISV